MIKLRALTTLCGRPAVALALCAFALALPTAAVARTDGGARTRLSSPIDGGAYIESTAAEDWGVTPTYTGPAFADEAAASAAEPAGTFAVAVTLPTWRNLYDWPGGHGYAGWHSATSAPPGAFAFALSLGGLSGLWIWATGGQQYTPNYAEWTYTAPGTTRIASAQADLAYRNKLLAHHCIKLGLRTDAATIASNDHCKPVHPPDSQREVHVSLADPSAQPTSKQLYFRVEMPPCTNAGSPSCSKNIPALDPLKNAGYARLKRVDMILVDDDTPQLDPSGTFIQSQERYDLDIEATDAGSGIKTITLEHVGQGQIAATTAPCDPTHQTAELDNRICPQSYSLSTTIDTASYAEGEHTFVARATDLAGNVGTTTWTITIDRRPPSAGNEVEVDFAPPVPVGDALAWAQSAGMRPIQLESAYPLLTDELTVADVVDDVPSNDAIAAEFNGVVKSTFDELAAEGNDYSSVWTGTALVGHMRAAAGSAAGAFALALKAPAAIGAMRLPSGVRTTVSIQRPKLIRRPARAAGCENRPFWPSSGRITTGPSYTPGNEGLRYVYQEFRWTQPNLDQLRCHEDVTYESDAVFYNYDRLHYLGKKKSWASNLPRKYNDTQFGDSKNELVYTVGSADAKKIDEGKVYWTVIRTKPGNAAHDKGKLQGQYGHRIVILCHSTWCVFADHTEYLIGTPRHPWVYTVPGSLRWTH